MSTTLGLLAALLLVLGNGFFVGVEFALLASRQTRLEALAETSRTARAALSATRSLPLMISGCQLGITLCSLALGAVAEPTIAALLDPRLDALGVSEALLHPISLSLALLIVSLLHIILGEMVPKNVALAGPERTAQLLAPALMGFVRVLRPLITVLSATATWVLRALGVEVVSPQASYTSQQVAELVAEAREEGLLGLATSSHLAGTIEFHQLRAREVLLPLSELVLVEPDVSPARIEELVGETGFSRFPVRAGTGGLGGYVHLADVIHLPPRRRELPLPEEMIRTLPRVGLDTPLYDVLALLQRRGVHLAQVTERGRALGVVTLEDVLEELVGEIRDATRTR